MSLVLVTTTVAQMLVPPALAIWQFGWQNLLSDHNSPHSPFAPGFGPVFGLNAGFARLSVVSALLFRQAADLWSKIRAEEPGDGAS